MKNKHSNQTPVIATILLSEVASALHYKDLRSVRKWCARNGVEVYDDGCNRKYLVKLQFEQARLKKFIRRLKQQHGRQWQDVFEAYAGNDLLRLSELDSVETSERIQNDWRRPMGEHERRFLSALTELTTAP